MSGQHISIDFPYIEGAPHQQGQLITWGHPAHGNARIQTDEIWFSPTQSSLTAFYADELFQEVSSLFFFFQSHKTIIGLKSGKFTDIAQPAFSARIIEKDIHNIQISAQGNFDYLTAEWQYVDNSGEESSNYFRHLYASNEENGTHVLPEIPPVLVDQYAILKMPVYYTRNLDVTDYAAADSYQDMLKSWFNDWQTRPYFVDFTTISYKNNNEGGRLKGSAETFEKEKFDPESYLKPLF